MPEYSSALSAQVPKGLSARSDQVPECLKRPSVQVLVCTSVLRVLPECSSAQVPYKYPLSALQVPKPPSALRVPSLCLYMHVL